MRKNILFILCLLMMWSLPFSIFAAEEKVTKNQGNKVLEDSIQVEEEKEITRPKTGTVQTESILLQEEPKEVIIDPSKKDDLYESRGTIVENIDSEGNPYVDKQKVEMFQVQSANNNDIYFLVDLRKIKDNVMLMGKTSEQELYSMVKNISEIEREKERTREEIAQANKQKLLQEEKEKEEKAEETKKSSFPLGKMIFAGAVVGVAIFFLRKYFKEK